ncbi:RluA family pseudouridine synthase [Rhodospirillum centenum]|uniref:RNA pseudouridine synthase, putative n=1 Tax=Rhodospirillum centenum (strain ATCC 51521 / SW) TaxID=414684 RepID=B6IU85_RHOCS|nr:RluA family pseudouridine synthase [Rhodospirillum centenum]ACI99962.1 RNA pseudouridine synthase, putative [Rhodospirillum centenum SW]
MTPEEIQARLLYRDGLMLILDKPAGIAVHGGPGSRHGADNLERYFEHLRFGLPRPPALAHRLDRDTSGCLVLGRHPKALRKLGLLFQDGRIGKTYWAVVRGGPEGDAGTIDKALLKRTDARRGWKMIALPPGTPEAQEAVTDWRVMGRGSLPKIGDLAWLELHPRTGRTHQIRAHCAAMGCPVLGDPVYGGRYEAEPLHLHSRAISVPVYATKPAVAVTAPVPPHLREALAACGWPGEG